MIALVLGVVVGGILMGMLAVAAGIFAIRRTTSVTASVTSHATLTEEPVDSEDDRAAAA